jgi:Uma2 family endonuclease
MLFTNFVVSMANPLPFITTVPTDTWVQTTWGDFLTFADDPTLVNGRFYYDEGWMRIEMLPIGSAHSQDNSIVSTVIVLYAAIKNIPIKELTNPSFRKVGIRQCQPDIAFYIGKNLIFPPRNNSVINLDNLEPPTLAIEIAASSLSDDMEYKLKLYQRLGVQEYWVVDVNANKVNAFAITTSTSDVIRQSLVLPGLDIDIIEQALVKSLSEDDGAISRWLLGLFNY